MYLHPEDAESFKRLLGTEDVPSIYAAEYAIWIGSYHRDLHSGPLGPLLIPMLRSCGWTPRFAGKEEVIETDWDGVQRGSRVEAMFFGAWQPGEFVGFGEYKVLLVKLDSEESIKECRRDMVRVAADQTPRVPVIDPDGPDARAELLDSKGTIEPEEIPLVYGDALHETDPETPAWQPASEQDVWDGVIAGEEVWLDIEGDTEQGKFIEFGDEGTIKVLMEDGVTMTFPKSQVARAKLTSA